MRCRVRTRIKEDCNRREIEKGAVGASSRHQCALHSLPREREREKGRMREAEGGNMKGKKGMLGVGKDGRTDAPVERLIQRGGPTQGDIRTALTLGGEIAQAGCCHRGAACCGE